MPREEYKCAECGVAVWRYPSENKGTANVMCSQSCLSAFRRHGSTLFCAWCDAPFYRRFGEQDRDVRDKQFCSRQCYAEWRVSKRTSYPKEGSRHKHRIVAEAVLGRPLTQSEVVHHIDEDRQNYQPSNLAVFPSQAVHARCHFGKMSAHELQGFSLTEIAARRQARIQGDNPA